AVLVGGLVAIELRYDLNHRDATRNIGLDRIVKAVEHEPPGTVLFGSTGTSGANFSAFDYGHPANVLDHLIALRVHSLRLADDDSCERAESFLHGSQAPRYGLWVFYAASADEASAATRALGHDAVDGHYFAIRSRRALGPRALIREGIRLRAR